MSDFHFAIEITSPEKAVVVKSIMPSLKDLDYETELKLNFLVFGPNGPWLMDAHNFNRVGYDHIQNGTSVNLKMLYRK